VRLAQRLGFDVETRTAELIPHAVGLLDRVSGARLLGEFRQLFAEPDPGATLHRLAEMGVLDAVRPGLTSGRRTGPLLDALPGAWAFWRTVAPGLSLPDSPTTEHALLLWLSEQSGPLGPDTARRLRMPGRWVRLLEAVSDLLSAPQPLDSDGVAPSRVHARLARSAGESLVLAWLESADPVLRRNLREYGTHLVGVRAEVTGTDLAALGLERGPVYRVILDELLRARLDGTTISRDEEIALALRIAED
jgi:tRNA nucleotidyltransferase (CCA-adding enzyme)